MPILSNFPTGGRGPAGADGKPATIRVNSTQTGEAGTQASVTNSGTETDAALDFVIPRGADGAQGPSGAPATINGVNALTLKATGGLAGQQSGEVYNIDGSGLVPKTTTVNGKPLSGNVSLAAGDVGAVPTTRTVNGKPLSEDIALNAADVGALPISGGTLTGQLNCGGRLLRGVANPASGQDAVNLQYLNSVVGNINTLLDTINGEVI